MRTTTIHTLCLSIGFALATGPAFAQQASAGKSSHQLTASPADQTIAVLAKDAPANPPGIEREPVRFSWAIDASTTLDAPQPFTATSRDYWTTVDATELARGHTVHTTRPGAMVLVSPERGAAAAVQPSDMRILRGGRVLDPATATDRNAPASELRAATGAPFAAGSLGFRLRPELGAGRFDIQLPDARGRYVVHVHEPDSPYALKLVNPDTTKLTGDAVSIDAELVAPAGTPPLQRLGGLLTAPDGRTFDLTPIRTAGGYRLQAQLPRQASSQPGLWEAHAFAVGEAAGEPLLRDAKVALEVTAPTARLGGSYAVTTGPDGLEVTVPLQVASEGRYEVRTVLHGTDASGSLRPAAVGHSADWLRPGRQALTLEFAPELYRGLTAPFELRQLSLGDQGRHGRLEYRENAARLEARDLRTSTTR